MKMSSKQKLEKAFQKKLSIDARIKALDKSTKALEADIRSMKKKFDSRKWKQERKREK